MRGTGWCLVVLGVALVFFGLVAPRTAPGTLTLNFGLMLEAFTLHLTGLFAVLGGIVLIAAARIATDLRPAPARQPHPPLTDTVTPGFERREPSLSPRPGEAD